MSKGKLITRLRGVLLALMAMMAFSSAAIANPIGEVLTFVGATMVGK